MRFAVLTDLQANLSAFSAVLTALDELQPTVDRIVCAGDVVGRGPQPNEVLDLLRDRSIETVRGNYDDAVAFERLSSGNDFGERHEDEEDQRAVFWTRQTLSDANLEYLRQLPRDVRLFPAVTGIRIARDELDQRTADYRRNFFARALFGGLARTPPKIGTSVLVVHGSPRALNEFVRADTAISLLSAISEDAQADIIVSGHAGQGFERKVGGTTYIGAGSVSGLRNAPGTATFTSVETGTELRVQFHDVRYDSTAYFEAMDRENLPVPSNLLRA